MPRPAPKTTGGTMVAVRHEMRKLNVSPQRLAVILGANQFSGWRWANGQSPMSQLYWMRLHLLTILREYRPDHWTNERIARGGIDWEGLHEHPHTPEPVTAPLKVESNGRRNGHSKIIRRYVLPHETNQDDMVA